MFSFEEIMKTSHAMLIATHKKRYLTPLPPLAQRVVRMLPRRDVTLGGADVRATAVT
jgi:hypothetical protein